MTTIIRELDWWQGGHILNKISEDKMSTEIEKEYF
jgi:hypothetical protein